MARKPGTLSLISVGTVPARATLCKLQGPPEVEDFPGAGSLVLSSGVEDLARYVGLVALGCRGGNEHTQHMKCPSVWSCTWKAWAAKVQLSN